MKRIEWRANEIVTQTLCVQNSSGASTSIRLATEGDLLQAGYVPAPERECRLSNEAELLEADKTTCEFALKGPGGDVNKRLYFIPSLGRHASPQELVDYIEEHEIGSLIYRVQEVPQLREENDSLRSQLATKREEFDEVAEALEADLRSATAERDEARSQLASITEERDKYLAALADASPFGGPFNGLVEGRAMYGYGMCHGALKVTEHDGVREVEHLTFDEDSQNYEPACVIGRLVSGDEECAIDELKQELAKITAERDDLLACVECSLTPEDYERIRRELYAQACRFEKERDEARAELEQTRERYEALETVASIATELCESWRARPLHPMAIGAKLWDAVQALPAPQPTTPEPAEAKVDEQGGGDEQGWVLELERWRPAVGDVVRVRPTSSRRYGGATFRVLERDDGFDTVTLDLGNGSTSPWGLHEIEPVQGNGDGGDGQRLARVRLNADAVLYARLSQPIRLDGIAGEPIAASPPDPSPAVEGLGVPRVGDTVRACDFGKNHGQLGKVLELCVRVQFTNGDHGCLGVQDVAVEPNRWHAEQGKGENNG